MAPRRLAALLLGACLWAGPVSAQRGGPVVIDSPAWKDLMAQPAMLGDLPAFHAADLIEAWGRPEEAEVLRRSLLLHHLRRAAGESPPTPATLGEVWQGSGAQPTPLEALAQAQQQALNHALAATADASPLPPDRAAEGWKAAGSGAWQRPGRVALALVVSNRSPWPLALLGLQRRQEGPGGVVLDCTPVTRVARLDAQQAARWSCEGAGSAATIRADAAARWVSTALASAGLVREMVRTLGDRPPLDLKAFVQRNESCIRQGTCPAVAAAAASRAAQRPRLSAEERYAAQRESEIKSEQQRRRRERLQNWIVVAYALGGLLLHLLVARAAGRIVATMVTLAIGPAIAVWMFFEYGIGSGWGALGMLILLGGLCVVGLPLAVAYNFIHKRFFAGL